ncbi:MAG TPA: globin domain-containing protein [Chloroflexaceae bacterium]|nr:globin domain-containing protein [Chloroflexaceae bacterium]
MDRAQITLVRASFNRLSPNAAALAARFYSRLFELDPALRPLFHGDMAKQGLKLMTTLQLAIGALDDVARIVPALEHLARTHLGYGVRDEHYATVGAALLDALADAEGAAFSPELRAAWAAAYGLLSEVMREAAAGAGRRAA